MNKEADRLWELYRLTPEEQEKIEAWQREHGLGVLMGTSTRNTGTDHCHTTGLIRGRLAFLLNKAMGCIDAFAKKDSPRILRALADYAENPPAIAALGAPRYGLIGKAQRKKKMIYGPPKEKK
jgi:hypothetical protein